MTPVGVVGVDADAGFLPTTDTRYHGLVFAPLRRRLWQPDLMLVLTEGGCVPGEWWESA